MSKVAAGFAAVALLSMLALPGPATAAERRVDGLRNSAADMTDVSAQWRARRAYWGGAPGWRVRRAGYWGAPGWRVRRAAYWGAPGWGVRRAAYWGGGGWGGGWGYPYAYPYAAYPVVVVPRPVVAVGFGWGGGWGLGGGWGGGWGWGRRVWW